MKKIAALGVLTAAALCIFVIESAVPPLLIIPIPGIKLGLANIITLFILFSDGFKTKDAALVLVARILLGTFITGSGAALLYASAGGAMAFLAVAVLGKLLGRELIPAVSAAGAAAHNIGQIAAAAAIYGRSAWFYLPALIFGGIISGLLTGIAAAIILKRIKR